jgi:hypothetical protein
MTGRLLRRAATLLLAALLLSACLSSVTVGDSCACQRTATRESYQIYVQATAGERMVLRPVEVLGDASGNPGLVAVRLLLEFSDRKRVFNAWHVLDEPITRAVAVSRRKGVVTVALSRQVWDRYPTLDFHTPADLDLAVQQLVHTVQSALGTDDPVRIVVGSREVHGVWMTPVDWPVTADPSVLQRSRTR